MRKEQSVISVSTTIDRFRVAWIAFLVLCLTLLLDLGLYLVNHRSASVFALTAGAAAFALGGITAAALVTRLSGAGVSRLRARMRRWRDVYLAVTLAILFVFGLGMRPEWVYV